MDEDLFKKCTLKLVEMGECIQDILENIEDVNEASISKIKDSIGFIYDSVNQL